MQHSAQVGGTNKSNLGRPGSSDAAGDFVLGIRMTARERRSEHHEGDRPKTTGIETAVEMTREATEGGLVDRFLERLAERVGGRANVTAVFGEPIDRRDLTVGLSGWGRYMTPRDMI